MSQHDTDDDDDRVTACSACGRKIRVSEAKAAFDICRTRDVLCCSCANTHASERMDADNEQRR